MNAAMPTRQRSMRPLIAHVVYRFDIGGLENGVVNLINRLPADRYDHAVIALTEVTDFRKRIVRDDVTFHSLHKPPGHGFAIHRKLHRLLRDLSPAIIHTRNIGASDAQFPALLAGVPIRIHGEHGWEVQDVAGGKGTHHLQRKLLKPLVHRFVALSGEIRRYLEDRIGVPADRIAQICNGVDVDRFAPRGGEDVRRGPRTGPVAQRFPDEGLFVVGTVGRLSPVKHQRLLVDAFVRACAARPDLAPRMRLAIAGDGPDRAAIEADVAASGIGDRIWIAGAREDVPAFLAGLDLFALPSLAEGISNTILEAMASGVAVLATRVGGNAELIADGSTGTIVPSDDVDAMVAAILGYAADVSRADHEGRLARTRAVETFGIDAMVARYDELYDGLLDTRRRSNVSKTATGALVAGN